jgi:hypothetical protein
MDQIRIGGDQNVSDDEIYYEKLNFIKIKRENQLIQLFWSAEENH